MEITREELARLIQNILNRDGYIDIGNDQTREAMLRGDISDSAYELADDMLAAHEIAHRAL